MYAIILAAGEGTRLRPHTLDKPKPMVPVDGVPILERQIAWLKQAGVTDVRLPEGYKAEAIQNYFGDGQDFGVTIHHLDNYPMDIGSVGHIKRALAEIPPREDVFVMAGDVMTDLDPNKLLREHIQGNNHLTLYTTKYTVPLGVIYRDDEGIVRSFSEKPPLEANTAIGIARSDISSILPEEKDKDFFGIAASLLLDHGGRVGALYDANARWFHITDGRDLELATREFREARLLREGSAMKPEGQFFMRKER